MSNEEATMKSMKRSNVLSVRTIAVVAVLSAMAGALMVLEVPLPFLPPFYKLDFGELPALLGGFALGPAAGAAIEALKVLIKMLIKGTTTIGIGDLTNFLVGCAFIVPAAAIYRKNKTRKGAVLGMVVGTLAMAVLGGLLNAYVMLPFYATAFGWPMDKIIAMGSAVNKAISDLPSFVLLATTPLNLLKGVSVSVITFLLYKRVSPILHGANKK
ncbi:MAG: ECF transporter S component [Oscillospiraceae bacterium]|jgi:riboflavin transporter FmnP|nr:ECF transporter S component [Oscillospiraceae bacterium]